jgi:hypothetical protein
VTQPAAIEKQLAALPWPQQAWGDGTFPFHNGLAYLSVVMDNAMAELRSGLALLPDIPELKQYTALRMAHHILGDTPWQAIPQTLQQQIEGHSRGTFKTTVHALAGRVRI